MKLHFILPSVLLLSPVPQAFAGSTPSTVDPAPIAIPQASPWQFDLSLYGWLTGLDGTVGIDGFTANVDDSFSDIFSDINMAAAARFEARYNRWGIIADGFYAALGTSGNPAGPLYENVDIELKQFIGELYVAYRVYESPSGFLDLYAGVRYNNISVDWDGSLDHAGIQSASANASARITSGIGQRAGQLVAPKVDAFRSGSAGARAAIESEVSAAIDAEADIRVKQDLEKQLVRIRREGNLRPDDVPSERIFNAVRPQREELAKSTAQLEVARLRASVDSSLQGKVAEAQGRVNQAEQGLADAIDDELTDRLPVDKSADENWLDPVVGFRAQWNINPQWYLAGRSDIGGFGAGSELTWEFLATVGYNFTEHFSTELGYRYLYTDYSNGGFTYDIADAGLYISFNYRF